MKDISQLLFDGKNKKKKTNMKKKNFIKNKKKKNT
jgi:hypothetical protein